MISAPTRAPENQSLNRIKWFRIAGYPARADVGADIIRPRSLKNSYKKTPFLRRALCASDQLLAEAVAAVNRTVGTGLEGNLAGFAAACAGCVIHLTVAAATGRALLAGSAAVFAALGFIGEALFCVEFLLAGGEGEALSAIFADDGLVAEHGNTSFVF